MYSIGFIDPKKTVCYNCFSYILYRKAAYLSAFVII